MERVSIDIDIKTIKFVHRNLKRKLFDIELKRVYVKKHTDSIERKDKSITSNNRAVTVLVPKKAFETDFFLMIEYQMGFRNDKQENRVYI